MAERPHPPRQGAAAAQPAVRLVPDAEEGLVTVEEAVAKGTLRRRPNSRPRTRQGAATGGGDAARRGGAEDSIWEGYEEGERRVLGFLRRYDALASGRHKGELPRPERSGADDGEDAVLLSLLRESKVTLSDLLIFQEARDCPIPQIAVDAHPGLEATRGHTPEQLGDAGELIETAEGGLGEQVVLEAARTVLHWRGLWDPGVGSGGGGWSALSQEAADIEKAADVVLWRISLIGSIFLFFFCGSVVCYATYYRK
eukprot:TRINITY_DN19215_c0_g1_i1.p1 TRINITY_DN19215_c0_g1~~TRINITY_DN19215_c0_g1_i1.p1  ORF type:complete len:255 (+),score=78.62 TRINITY_DN19215_c0_g1_i1:122-886(+)